MMKPFPNNLPEAQIVDFDRGAVVEVSAEDLLYVRNQPQTLQAVTAPVVIFGCTPLDLTIDAHIAICTAPIIPRSIHFGSEIGHLYLCADEPTYRPPEAHLFPPLREIPPNPDNTCRETGGLTMWHLYALGMTGTWTPYFEYQEKAAKVPDAELRRDLWECTGEVCPKELARYARSAKADIPLLSVPEEVLAPLLSLRTPLELCAMAGMPFLAGEVTLQDYALVREPVQELIHLSERLLRRTRPLQNLKIEKPFSPTTTTTQKPKQHE